MVLELDAENEKLRVVMQTLKEMIFGKPSDWLAAIGVLALYGAYNLIGFTTPHVAEQLALELGDLATGVTLPAPANDDTTATTPPASHARKESLAVVRQHNAISKTLSNNPDRFAPIHPRKSNGEVDARRWRL
jgi:hypothetical protein